MRKRGAIRSIKSARIYTVGELAETLGVSRNTVRAWSRAGLPTSRDVRPHLIQGKQAKAWLTARATKRHRKLTGENMLCTRCKEHAAPMGGMVDSTVLRHNRVLLCGLCPHCGTPMHRFVSMRQLPEFARIFDIRSTSRTAP